MQIECGLKCLDTDGCVTLRFKDDVCDLGGFHGSHDGPESEMCYLNEGEFTRSIIVNQKKIDLFQIDLYLYLRIHRRSIRRSYHHISCLGSRVRDQL